MTRKPSSTGAFRAAVVSALAAATSAFAQSTEPPTANPPPVPDKPIPVETAPQVDDKDELIVLSPFEVNTAADRGYQATSTLAGSRINTKLKDVGSAIQVVTGAFLRDTNSTNSKDLLIYTTGTEVGGVGGNFMGAGNGPEIGTQNHRARPQQNTRVRGLAEADNTRNFFVTDIPWDSYNIDRVEIQRGANSLLYGQGSPAGIVNTSIRGAAFKTSGQLDFRFSSYGSTRTNIDYNQVLLPNELALRVDALYEHEKFQQKPAYNKDRRGFIALRYDPKFLNNDVMRTSLKAYFEGGRVRANNPDPTPPIDAITPWFTQLNKATYDSSYAWASDPAVVDDPALASRRPGALRDNSRYWSPWVGNMGRIYDNIVFLYGDPNSSTPGGSGFPGAMSGTNKPLMAPGQSITGLMASQLLGIRTYKDYASKAALPGSGLGVYKTKSLTDSSIFDFYNNLLGGPNDHQDEDWEAFNAEFTQSFWDNRLAYAVAFDKQRYEQEQEYMFQGFANAITIDINSHLPDGSPNPNVGRPAVASDSGHNSGLDTSRESFRVSVTGSLRSSDFFDRDSVLTKILGHHSLTVLYGREQYDRLTTNWSRWTTDDEYGGLIQSTSGPNRQIATISYLGGSLMGASTASGANVSRVRAVQSPSSMAARIFNSQAGTLAGSFWETRNLGVWNTANGDIAKLYSNASKTRQTDEGRAFIWQGYMFGETLVPLFGVRKDKSTNRTAGPPGVLNGATTPFDPRWKLSASLDPQYRDRLVEDTTKTWGAVLHTPKFIQKSMPWGTSLSLSYNRSQNFRPAPGRIGVRGEPLDSPTGRTKDYGIMLSTLNDRVILRVNWYETRSKNTDVDGGVPGGFYMIGDSEAWGYLFAKQAQARYGSFATDYVPGPGQTQAQATAEENLAVSTFLGNLESDAFWKAWNIRGGGVQLTPATADATNAWQGWMEGPNSPSLAITGDTLSKGVEFEFTARPVDNWDITFNASKTKATRLNLAGSVSEWIEARHAFFEGPAGLVRLWDNGYSPTETLRQKFNNETYSAYQLLKLQEGGNVPELRPWRFNLVTTYRFDRSFLGGKLNGLTVGGAYRWQDKQVVGYPLTSDNLKVDISRPYKSPTETNFDFWIGYERKLGKGLVWSIQLNAKNAFADKDLIPVSVQPDGSYGQVRIPEETIYSVTNTLKF